MSLEGASTGPKRRRVSLDAKIRAIALVEQGKSIRQVAKELGISKGSVQGAIKNKAVLSEEHRNGSSSSRKRSRSSHLHAIRVILQAWIDESVALHLPLSRPQIEQVVPHVAAALGYRQLRMSESVLEEILGPLDLRLMPGECRSGSEVSHAASEVLKAVLQRSSDRSQCSEAEGGMHHEEQDIDQEQKHQDEEEEGEDEGVNGQFGFSGLGGSVGSSVSVYDAIRGLQVAISFAQQHNDVQAQEMFSQKLAEWSDRALMIPSPLAQIYYPNPH